MAISPAMELAWLQARYDGGPYPPGIWDRMQRLATRIARAAEINTARDAGLSPRVHRSDLAPAPAALFGGEG